MTVFCTYCNKKISRKPSQIKRAKNSFCSKNCHNNWMKENQKGSDHHSYNRVEVNCGFCKGKIKVTQHKFKSLQEGKVKNLFCDKRCLANWQKEKFTKSPKIFEKRCPQCKEKYQTMQKNQKFCSQNCLSESRRVEIELACDYCKSLFIKIPSQIRDNNFCSKHCSEQWSSIHNSTQVTKICWSCKNKYKITKSQDENSNSVCCSLECLKIWKSEYYPKTEKGVMHLRKSGISSMIKQQKYKETKPEREVSKFLLKNKIYFVPQKLMYDKFIVDFYLPKHNIIIEVLGDYWHGNPDIYGTGDKLKPLTERMIKQQKKDKSRFAYLTKCGHDVFMVWENDIYNNIEMALSFLKN